VADWSRVRCSTLAWLLLLLLGCGRSGFDLVGDSDSGAGETDLDSDADADAPSLAYEAVFTSIAAASPPSPRRSSGAAVEPGTTERIWIYGGYDGTFLGDVHAFTPSSGQWAPISTTGAPGARERHALAWHPAANVLVLYGGQNLQGLQLVHHATISYLQPSTGTWTTLSPAGSWPAARKDAALLWLPHLGQFLMYGGNDGGAATDRFSDVWLLTLSTGTSSATWQQLSPGGVAAPALSSACTAYDPIGRRLIVYGGETADGVDGNTTYQYLVDSNVWQLDAATGTPPPGESFSQCTWDPVARRVVVFGGQQDGGAPLGGTSTYDPDSQTWAQPTIVAAGPAARSDAGALYSEYYGALFWFGGRPSMTSYTSDSWMLDIQ